MLMKFSLQREQSWETLQSQRSAQTDQREAGRWEAACELTLLHSLLRVFQGA